MSLLLTLLVLLCVVQHILRHMRLTNPCLLLAMLPCALAPLCPFFVITVCILRALLCCLLLLDLARHCLLQGYEGVRVNVSKLGGQVLRQLLRQQQQQVALQLLGYCNSHTAVHTCRDVTHMQHTPTRLCCWCCHKHTMPGTSRSDVT
jgi:hypothetical protein